MKKSFISALTAAAVIGAASTTLAAANPFSDVPNDHWAIKAIEKMAADGIIEGYGDGTFRGDRNITRYEAAQMIAKAMAKQPAGSKNADLDRLVAEFRDELDNLGVRVEALEKNSDMVKWTGEARYRYWNDNRNLTTGKHKAMRSQLQFRLFPTATVNEHWKAKARLTATEDFRADSTGDVQLTYIFAEGKYDKFTVNLGRMPFYTNADKGIIADDFFSGAQVVFGDKLKFQLQGGRWHTLENSNYVGGEVLYDNGTLDAGVGYHHFEDFAIPRASYGNKDKADIWAVGAGYKFGDIKLSGAFTKNEKAESYDKGYNIQLDYAGANRNKAGSWGAFAAYRYVGVNVGLAPTFDPWYSTTNKKGVEVGATYSPLKNTLTKLSYFHGKTLANDKTDKQWFGRLSYFF